MNKVLVMTLMHEYFESLSRRPVILSRQYQARWPVNVTCPNLRLDLGFGAVGTYRRLSSMATWLNEAISKPESLGNNSY